MNSLNGSSDNNDKSQMNSICFFLQKKKQGRVVMMQTVGWYRCHICCKTYGMECCEILCECAKLSCPSPHGTTRSSKLLISVQARFCFLHSKNIFRVYHKHSLQEYGKQQNVHYHGEAVMDSNGKNLNTTCVETVVKRLIWLIYIQMKETILPKLLKYFLQFSY